jgi:hypothetical protein
MAEAFAHIDGHCARILSNAPEERVGYDLRIRGNTDEANLKPYPVAEPAAHCGGEAYVFRREVRPVQSNQPESIIGVGQFVDGGDIVLD